MKMIALVNFCYASQSFQAGDEVDVAPGDVRVLEAIGRVGPLGDPAPAPAARAAPAPADAEADETPLVDADGLPIPAKSPRGRYSRRDLKPTE
jgi:hypothetical protein